MASDKNLVIEVLKNTANRVVELSTDTNALKANIAPSTGIGVAGIGGLAIFSPELHASIGGLETLQQQVLHFVVGVVEVAFAAFSLYLTLKTPGGSDT